MRAASVSIEVLQYDGLAHYYAKKYYRKLEIAGVIYDGLEDDLIKAGREGLSMAYKRYDAGKGAVFSVFAAKGIKFS